jgi:hypothetical protein
MELNFRRVSKASPCPQCGKPDWCTVGDYGVVCMRVQSARPVKNGGWFHAFDSARGGKPSLGPPPPRREPPRINATALHRAWLANTKAEALAVFAASLGLTVASVTAVGAAWAAPHAAWAFPMCDGYGNVVGIRLRSERGKFAVRGSRQGIFLSEGRASSPSGPPSDSQLSTLNSQLFGSTLFVCEGPTDTAAAVELGLFAAGRPNCCCGGAEIRTHARRHRCANAVLVSDNDKPGLDGARRVGSELGLPWAVYVPPAKDLREFVRLGGTRAMIENTLKHTVWNV